MDIRQGLWDNLYTHYVYFLPGTKVVPVLPDFGDVVAVPAHTVRLIHSLLIHLSIIMLVSYHCITFIATILL